MLLSGTHSYSIAILDNEVGRFLHRLAEEVNSEEEKRDHRSDYQPPPPCHTTVLSRAPPSRAGLPFTQLDAYSIFPEQRPGPVLRQAPIYTRPLLSD
jgi:hypothetical protein